jgi:hypothetical protein
MLLVRGGSRVGDATRSSGSWSNPWIALSVGENELECLISSETGASAQETVYLSDARRCRELIFWRLRGFIELVSPKGWSMRCEAALLPQRGESEAVAERNAAYSER